MNNHKYYKVKEKTNNIGEKSHELYAYDSLAELLFGVSVRYSKEDGWSFDGAKEHIEELATKKVRKTRTVFSKTIK